MSIPTESDYVRVRNMARASRQYQQSQGFAQKSSPVSAPVVDKSKTPRDELHVRREKRTVDPRKQAVGCVAGVLRKKFAGGLVVELSADRHWAQMTPKVRNKALARAITNLVLPFIDNKDERICSSKKLPKLTEDAIFNVLSAGKSGVIRAQIRCEPGTFSVWTPPVKLRKGSDGRPEARIKRMKTAIELRRIA